MPGLPVPPINNNARQNQMIYNALMALYPPLGLSGVS